LIVDLHLGNAGQHLAQMEDMASMTSLAQTAGSTKTPEQKALSKELVQAMDPDN